MEPLERRGKEYKMKEKVSVIIPVYNTEKYLSACMDSVLEQDYPNIEVILVDDGSTDGCSEICDKYAEKNACVMVLHRENQGAGAARNAGLEKAAGTYVCFVDSDDCLDGAKAVSLLVQRAKETNADIVVGNFRQLMESGVSEVYSHHLEAGEYTKTVDFRFKGFFQYGHLGFNWGKCYKKSFLDKYHLRCTSVPFTEDKAMNLCCCVCEPNYAFVAECVYLYRFNEKSVTSEYHSDVAQIWINTAGHLYGFLEKKQLTGRYGDLVDFHICLGVFTIVRQELQAGSKKIRNIAQKIEEYGENLFVKECLKELAQGKYVSEIGSLFWKILIRTASVALKMRRYALVAWCFWFLDWTKLDKKIIAFKYKK